MGWKHYQTVDPRKREPQVARRLFGIRLLILHFKFQFSKSIKSSTFHIFLKMSKMSNVKCLFILDMHLATQVSLQACHSNS